MSRRCVVYMEVDNILRVTRTLHADGERHVGMKGEGHKAPDAAVLRSVRWATCVYLELEQVELSAIKPVQSERGSEVNSRRRHPQHWFLIGIIGHRHFQFS